MVKKQPIRVRGKKVIDALREGKKSWSELRKLDIPEKTLQRILQDYLQYWGLVEKKEKYWVWYEYLRVFSSEGEYKAALEHSRKLLDTFDLMKMFCFDLEDPLFLSAKEHLRSYPEIYKNLEKLEEVTSQKNEELIQRISQSINDPRKRLDQYKYHPFQIIPFLLTWNPSPDDVETRDNLVAALKPDFEDCFQTYREFSGDVSLLKLKVEMGTPLEGKCFSCPKIKIKKGDEKQSE